MIFAATVVGLTLLIPTFASATRPAAQTPPPTEAADAWVARIGDRAGLDRWREVERLTFATVVEEGDRRIARIVHDWDVTAGVVRVDVAGRTVEVSTTDPGNDATRRQAHRRWSADTFRLLMPLLLTDPGTNVVLLGREEVGGETFVQLRLTFDPEAARPSDEVYLIYADETGLIRYTDALPDAHHRVRFTRESHHEFEGLTLATLHRTVGQEPERRVRFEAIEVTRGTAGGE